MSYSYCKEMQKKKMLKMKNFQTFSYTGNVYL